jgi:hypothetical protein
MSWVIRVGPAEWRARRDRRNGSEGIDAQVQGGMPGRVASGDDGTPKPGFPQNAIQDPPEAGSNPIVDLAGRQPTCFDRRAQACDGRIIRAGSGVDEWVPTLANGGERLVRSASQLLLPFRRINGTGSVEANPNKAVSLRKGDLPCSYRRARARDADNPFGWDSSEFMVWFAEQACGLPMSDQCILKALRADRKETPSPILPNKTTCCGKGLVINDIDRHDLGSLSELLLQPRTCLATLQGEIVNESDTSISLPLEVAADIRLVHRSYGMARHRWMPVQPISNTACNCEQVPEDLIAPNGWIGNHERVPFAAQHRCRKINRLPD